MAEPTYSELQKSLSHALYHEKKLKERSKFWKDKAKEERKKLKRLTVQYERLIKEWRKMYNEVVDNGWKLLFVKVYNKFTEIKERFT